MGFTFPLLDVPSSVKLPLEEIVSVEFSNPIEYVAVESRTVPVMLMLPPFVVLICVLDPATEAMRTP